jgi:tRNA-modifying protein YgfZ
MLDSAMVERGGVESVVSGEAFVDLSFWRKIAVTGQDAFMWLNDLVSADIGDLEPGRARRALLLGPTGRVRAEFSVAIRAGHDGALLLQDPSQPTAVDDLLSPYVLSSDVVLSDRSNEVAMVALPGRSDPPEVAGTDVTVPSCLGGGVGLLAPAEAHDQIVEALRRGFADVGGEAVETWRVLAGLPRFGVDGTAEDLPQECGLEDAVSFQKGCYLGQEAMAKVKNLGHPRRILLHLEGAEPVSPGQVVTTDRTEVGEVTSAARHDGRTVVLAKVAWEAREGPFHTGPGGVLLPVATRAGGQTADQAWAK